MCVVKILRLRCARDDTRARSEDNRCCSLQVAVQARDKEQTRQHNTKQYQRGNRSTVGLFDTDGRDERDTAEQHNDGQHNLKDICGEMVLKRIDQRNNQCRGGDG